MLGVIGRNGAGKITLLKILSRITEPTAGRARTARPRRQPARGRHRLPPRADRAREHLPERRDPGHEPARRSRASSTRSWPSPRSRHSSTRRSSAIPAACTSGWRSPSPRISSRRSCSSTKCWRSATPRSRRSAWARWATSRATGPHRAVRQPQHAEHRKALSARGRHRRRAGRIQGDPVTCLAAYLGARAEPRPGRRPRGGAAPRPTAGCRCSPARFT